MPNMASFSHMPSGLATWNGLAFVAWAPDIGDRTQLRQSILLGTLLERTSLKISSYSSINAQRLLHAMTEC